MWVQCQSTKHTAVTFMLVALAITLIAAGQTLASSSRSGACVDISTSPPGVQLNPECRPIRTQASLSIQSVNETPNATDVLVNLTSAGDDAEVLAFKILRDVHPELLHPVVAVAPEDQTFVDRNAVAQGEASWYAVAITWADGPLERSDVVFVDVGVPA